MELNHLKYFYIVAREGGYTNASKVLRVAQPSISKLVRRLEEEYGVPLFEKVGRKVRLTGAGGTLYRHCEVIFQEVEQIAALSGVKNKTGGGPLNIGASDAIASFLLPDVLGSLVELNLSVQPTVISAPATDLLDRLRARKLETVLLLHCPTLSSELEIRKEILVPHCFIISAKHFESKEVRSSFIGSREVDDSSTKDFPTFRLLKKDYPNAVIKISINSFAAHKALVKEGRGVSIMPEFVAEPELSKGVFRRLYPKEKFEWPIKVVMRKDSVASKSCESFLDALKKTLEISRK